MNRITPLLLGCAVMNGAALLDSPVSAQQSQETKRGPASLDEIVVTATKRAEVLQDVPVAVTAITSADILARGFTNYTDFFNTVPNAFVENLGPGKENIYIRGLVAQGQSGFPVATYFGEAVTSVVSNNGGFADMRLVDIDRVEVLRGPQGTLFGANSLAGVMRIVPAAPNLTDYQVNLDTRGYATAHSSQGSDHVEAVLNLPLINDRLAVRLVGYQDYIAGFIDNVVPAAAADDYSAALGAPPGTLVIPGHVAFTRKDINSENIWGARAAVTWKPTDQLRVDLSYAAQGVTLNSEPGVQQAVGPYAVQRALDLYSRGSSKEDMKIGQVVVTYDWSAVTLTSASSYTQMKRSSASDFGFLAAAAGLGDQLWPFLDRSTAGTFTQEFRLQSRSEGPLQWLAGAFYTNTFNDLGQMIPDESCPTCLPEVLLGQSFAINTSVGGGPDQVSEKQRQRSVFGEVNYSFTPRWTLGAGGRYLQDSLASFGTAAEGFLVSPTGFAPAAPTVGGSSSIFNPSGYLRFKATDDMTYYLQAARGFRSGNSNQALSYDPNGPCAASAKILGLGPLTDPDTLWTYELGLKSVLWQQRLAANLALFHQKWSGVQLLANQPCGFDGVLNGGDASGNGAELEMSARINSAWSANLSASYVHNKFDSVKPYVGFAVGDRVPGAPEENASAGLQYDFAINSRWKGYARGDYVYVGDVHYRFDPGTLNIGILQGGYAQANLRLTVQRDNLSLELFGHNVTDKRAAVATGDPTQNGFTYLLRPREIGIEVRYSYDRPRR
jgi:iron complex outermembrane receptor protein